MIKWFPFKLINAPKVFYSDSVPEQTGQVLIHRYMHPCLLDSPTCRGQDFSTFQTEPSEFVSVEFVSTVTPVTPTLP